MSDQAKSRRGFKPLSLSPPPSFPHSSSSSSSSVIEAPTLIPKMARKALLKQTLIATILTFLANYAFFYAFLYPINPTTSKFESSFPFDSSSSSSYRSLSLLSTESRRYFQNFPGNSAPVKVYMYELPRKFTYGVIENYAMARGGSPVSDDSTMKYPGNQHSAEWYLFSDMIRDDKDRDGSPVVKVTDPEEADLFYVPFFSSLSLVANPIRPVKVAVDSTATVYSDEETQEALIEWLESQAYWKRNNGWDHVYICQDPNALYKVIDQVKNGVLLLSDFGRLMADQASFVKDVILPYSHRISPYDGGFGVEDRRSLLFFLGNRYRKETLPYETIRLHAILYFCLIVIS